MDKSLIRCFGISIIVLTISGCSNTSQVGQNGLITGVNESDIEKQTSALTGLSGDQTNKPKKREMTKPETEFFPEMPKNTLKSKQFNRVLSANKIKFKDGSSIELIGIQTEKNSTRREFVEFQPENCQKTLEAILLDEKNVFVEIISGDEEGEMYGYLWIGNSKELRNVNALLLQEGLAKVVRISDVTKYDESFHVIEQEAYRSKLGIWKEIDKK